MGAPKLGNWFAVGHDGEINAQHLPAAYFQYRWVINHEFNIPRSWGVSGGIMTMEFELSIGEGAGGINAMPPLHGEVFASEGKEVVIATPEFDDDLWFVYEFSYRPVVSETPQEAISQILNRISRTVTSGPYDLLERLGVLSDDVQSVRCACQAAKQARFEHGAVNQ